MRNAVLDACKTRRRADHGRGRLRLQAGGASATQKIKKGESGRCLLELVKNADFFHEVPDGSVKVGFAAETEDLLENAAEEADREAPRPDLRQRRHPPKTPASVSTQTA